MGVDPWLSACRIVFMCDSHDAMRCDDLRSRIHFSVSSHDCCRRMAPPRCFMYSFYVRMQYIAGYERNSSSCEASMGVCRVLPSSAKRAAACGSLSMEACLHCCVCTDTINRHTCVRFVPVSDKRKKNVTTMGTPRPSQGHALSNNQTGGCKSDLIHQTIHNVFTLHSLPSAATSPVPRLLSI